MLNDLSEGDVFICVYYLGVNYKDSLVSIVNGNIVISYLFVLGIDLVGVVVFFDSFDFKEGDYVIVISYDIGVLYFGGYSEYVCICSEWIVFFFENLMLKEVMIIGIVGFIVVLFVYCLEENYISLFNGFVFVIGVMGGVGSFVVVIFLKLGYIVEVSMGKSLEVVYLKKFGVFFIVVCEDVFNGKLKVLGK